MKKNFIYLLFFIFIGSCFAINLGSQTVIPATHWIYDDLNLLCLESGVSSFAVSAPRTIDELRLYLNEINFDELSNPGKKMYKKIQNFFEKQCLGFSSGLVSAGLSLDIALEGYFKTNENLQWIHPYQLYKPLIKVPLGFSLGNYLTIVTDLSIEQNIEAKKAHKNYLNIPFPLSKFDVNFPHSAYGSAGFLLSENTGVNLRVARGPQFIGKSATGSVILSEYSSNESYCEFSIFSPKLRYALNITELNPPKKDNPNPAYMYLHRLEFKLFEKLTFIILEGVLVNSPFELRFLNPFMIMHGFASWNDYYGKGNNSEDDNVRKEASLLGLNINFVPCKGLELYVLYAMNQFQTNYERKNWPDSAIPNAITVQGGLNLSFPMKNGYLYGNIEGVYATPYMYLMEGADWSYIREYDESIGMNDVREWVGNPFGSDSIVTSVLVGYKVPDFYNISCGYLFAAQGELSDLSILDKDYWPLNAEQASVSSLTGIVEFSHRLLLTGQLFILENICLELSPSYVVTLNSNHIKENLEHGFEIIASCSVSLF